jgi:hypothetical protein
MWFAAFLCPIVWWLQKMFQGSHSVQPKMEEGVMVAASAAVS